MADNVATMRTQLDDLPAAYQAGAVTVSYEGKSVTYRSAAEMQAAIRSLERQVGLDTQPKRVIVRTSKGW
jgi:hypothetical protein